MNPGDAILPPMPEPPRRPTATATVHTVDGGLFQARCGCRYLGRRHEEWSRAAIDVERHNAMCGLCERVGRGAMAVCECQPCVRRRGVFEEWTARRQAWRDAQAAHRGPPIAPG